jgi:hypothetical protein
MNRNSLTRAKYHRQQEVEMGEETLEQLQERTARVRAARVQKRQQSAQPRKPTYVFLPKKEKQVIDFVDVELVIKGMEDNQVEPIVELLGIIANLKRIGGQISEAQQHALDCVQQWYQKAKIYDEAVKDQSA